MTEKKMTESEIMKALELCSNENGMCSECIYSDDYTNCNTRIAKDTLGLINRKNAEIRRLRKYDEERDIRLHARLTETARAEAIKEFAEMLKEELSFGKYIQADQIDQIAKEMGVE